MVPYFTGALAGAAYGMLVGYIKYSLLWKRVMKSDEKMTTGALYLHLGISYAINVVTLLLIFLFRNVMPCNFAAALIAAAVALSLAGKLAPIGEIMTHVEEKKAQ